MPIPPVFTAALFTTVKIRKNLSVCQRINRYRHIRECYSIMRKKDWCWSWNSNTLVTWCEELTHWTHWKRPWCWEGLKVGGEGDDRGWDGWMASLIRWTWVWARFGRWWRTGKPGMLQSMGHKELDMTEWLNWTEL